MISGQSIHMYGSVMADARCTKIVQCRIGIISGTIIFIAIYFYILICCVAYI